VAVLPEHVGAVACDGVACDGARTMTFVPPQMLIAGKLLTSPLYVTSQRYNPARVGVSACDATASPSAG
jgi:hypothetical protein